MSRLLDRRNAKRVNGLRRDPRTGAGKLAKSERGYGGVLAFDFTDNSVALYDPTTQANIAYSQGVTDGNGNFRGVSSLLTYTSPSNKLTLQSDGFIKYQAHNLYLNSAAPANQSITVVSGASYAVTITGTVSVTASGAATGTWTAGTNTFTAATTTLTLGSTSGSGTVHVRRTPSNDDYIETAGAAKYALPLEYDTSGNCLGLLVEEARTNLLTYSQMKTGAVSGSPGTSPTNWTYFSSGTASSTVATSGGMSDTGYLQLDVTSGRLFAYQNPVVSVGVTYCQSVLVEVLSGTTSLQNLLSSAAGGTALTSVQGYVDGVATALTAEVTAGVHLVSRVYTADGSGTVQMRYGLGCTATQTGSVRLLHSQFEAGSFPTSPVVTYGSASSRLADNISIATSAFPWSATAGSAYTYTSTFDTSLAVGCCSFYADSANYIELHGDINNHLRVLSGGATQAAVDAGTRGINTFYKQAAAWEENNFNAALSGSVGTPDTSGSIPASVATAAIARKTGTSTGFLNGHIKAISYVPRRKTDAELQTETT